MRSEPYSVPTFEPQLPSAYAGDRQFDDVHPFFIPAIVNGTVEDLRLGTEVAQTTYPPNEHITSVGLASFIRTRWHGVPTIIMDNHNHALYFWAEAVAGLRTEYGAQLVHVDFHDDLARAKTSMAWPMPLSHVYDFVIKCTTVGSFIDPALEVGLVSKYAWARSVGDAYWQRYARYSDGYILDIDMDFFRFDDSEMDHDTKMYALRCLARHTSLITIATSPLFIDQGMAIRYIKEMHNGE